MSGTTTFICLKSSFVALCLLMLQTSWAQYNWSTLDSELQTNQQMLGNDLVMMIWKKDDTLYIKKKWRFQQQKRLHR
jgi:hypothetical protein